MKIEKLLPWVLVAGAFYTLYKFKTTVGDAAGDVAAKIYTWLRNNPNVRGALILPDFRAVSFSGLRTYWVGDQLRVTVDGIVYQIHPRDERGNYPATKIT